MVLPAELRDLDRIAAGQEFEIARIGPGEYRMVRQSLAANEGVLDWLLACPAKGLIAATALVHRLTVVTGNRADFAHAGVTVRDPFHSAS